MMTLLNKIIKDLHVAQDNQEEHNRLAVFYKGNDAELTSLVEHMSFDYLPVKLQKLIYWKIDKINWFFKWIWDFERISFLTLIMICLIIYLTVA